MTYKGDKKIIIDYLQSLRNFGSGWVMEGKVRSLNTPFGWIGFRGDRNCRDLINDGILERTDGDETGPKEGGKYAWVRYKSKEPEQTQMFSETKRFIFN